MPCCALDDCGNPLCDVCSVPRRFAVQIALQRRAAAWQTEKEAAGLKDSARKLAGVTPRASRDPRFVARRRKPLT